MHFDVDSQSPNLIIKNILAIYKAPKAFQSARKKRTGTDERKSTRAHAHKHIMAVRDILKKKDSF